MPGERHLPLLTRRAPELDDPVILRGIVSPCTGCRNQVPVPTNPTARTDDYPKGEKAWACPKAILYAQKSWSKDRGSANINFNHPIYDDKLRGTNPYYAGTGGYDKGYSYVWVATYEDNIDNGWNPTWDTTRIRCRGPYLIATSERLLNILGHLEQGDHLMVFSRYYYLDGAEFRGFAMEAATWQVHSSATRKIDGNLVSSTSGAL